MTSDETQVALGQILSRFRRALVRDGMLEIVRMLGDEDISLTQLATLFLLQGPAGADDQTGRDHARAVCLGDRAAARSIGTARPGAAVRGCARSAGQARGDHRAGRGVHRDVAYHRAGAQLTLMRHLTAEEQAAVMRGMTLLAEAARRSEGDDDSSGDNLVW